MAEATEQKQDAQPKEAEKRQGHSELEKKANEWAEFTDAALGTTAAGAASYFFGLDGLVTALSFPIGGWIVQKSKADGKGKYTLGNFRDDSIAGALFAPAIWYGVNTIKQIPKVYGLEGLVTNILGYSVPVSPFIVAGAALGILTPVLNALYYPLQCIIQNKTLNPKKIYTDLKQNYWKGFKRSLITSTFASGAIGATYAMPYLAPYLFPFLALTNVAYRVFLSPEKISYKKALGYLFYPLILPVSLGIGLGSLLAKGLKGFYNYFLEGPNDAGKSISDAFAGALPKTAK